MSKRRKVAKSAKGVPVTENLTAEANARHPVSAATPSQGPGQALGLFDGNSRISPFVALNEFSEVENIASRPLSRYSTSPWESRHDHELASQIVNLGASVQVTETPHSSAHMSVTPDRAVACIQDLETANTGVPMPRRDDDTMRMVVTPPSRSEDEAYGMRVWRSICSPRGIGWICQQAGNQQFVDMVDSFSQGHDQRPGIRFHQRSNRMVSCLDQEECLSYVRGKQSSKLFIVD